MVTTFLVAVVLSKFGEPIGIPAMNQNGKIDKKDTMVEPTSWGNVEGRVYNAIDGSPIMNAQVSLQTDEGFKDKGRSTDKTDELGKYRAQSVLGRISHNLDAGRLLLTSGLGLLLGGASNTTLRIDSSRIAMRVTAPGYKPFEGVVVARRQNASAFQIDLQPVLLVPEGSEGISISADGWTAVRIQSANVEPAIAKKGDLVKLSVDVRAFGKNPKRTIELGAESRLWKGEKVLKMSKTPGVDGTIRFETDYRISGREKYNAELVYFYIRKSELEYNPDRSLISVLVQVAATPDEEQAAKDRTEGLRLYNQNKPEESAKIFKKLTSIDKPSYCDLHFLAEAADRQADYETEAMGWARLAQLAGKDDNYEVSQYVRALYMSKRYTDIPPLVEPFLKSKKTTDWEKETDARSVAYLGLSYLKLDQIDRATQLNEKLLDWPTSGLNSTVIEFRNVLRLNQVEKSFAANPTSPDALAEYGRALLDLGRYEEAVAKLSDSLKQGKDMPAVRRDLAWAALQMRGKDPQTKDLETAVAEAKEALNIGKGKQESKDFFSWNQYAVLVYALSEQQRVTSNPAAAATNEEAIAALRKALTMGRKGALRSSGAFDYKYGYLSSAEVAISGFAYPQANSSYVLLDSLKLLRKNPNDHLALFNRASALLDLGQYNLAKLTLDQLEQVKPGYPEGLYLQALLEARTKNGTKAQEYLNKLLAVNPIHPRANLTLAELLAEDGDVAGSAEHLALHAKFYGEAIAGGK